MGELSSECFWAHCGECRDGTCRCRCHDDEEYDPISREWVETDGD